MRTTLLSAAALILMCPAADAAQWRIDLAKSKLGFVVTWDREPFRASFNRWTANIDFDPAKLFTAAIIDQARKHRKRPPDEARRIEDHRKTRSR